MDHLQVVMSLEMHIQVLVSKSQTGEKSLISALLRRLHIDAVVLNSKRTVLDAVKHDVVPELEECHHPSIIRFKL